MFALYWPAKHGEPATRHGKVSRTERKALERLARAPVGASVRTWPEDITHAVKRASGSIARLVDMAL